MKQFLIIQTAFLGDVILATPLIRELKIQYPDAEIDLLVRKGNEQLVMSNPHIREVLIWNKKAGKYRQLFSLLKRVRKQKYDEVIGIQRYFNSGLLTALSGASSRVGFSENPLSFLFTRRVPHQFGDGTHEVTRNFELVAHHSLSPTSLRPELFPSTENYLKIQSLVQDSFYCFAPASVWFTKQLPLKKWLDLAHHIGCEHPIYILGGPGDFETCEEVLTQLPGFNCTNLAGKLNLLESAALMSKATRNYVNDSGPLHLSSAMNAPVTAFFCSTVPEFGFGPLSDDSQLLETTENLECRPCGIHGHKSCPKGHFKCATTLPVEQARY